MSNKHAIIVDDQPETLKIILATLADAQWSFVQANNTEDILDTIQQPDFPKLVLLRTTGREIDGIELCRRIRQIRSREELCVISLVEESELSLGADALIAGANDILVGAFEPRELRMRAQIVPPDLTNRFDQAHVIQAAHDDSIEPQTHEPTFDPRTCTIGFGALNSSVAKWEAAPGTRKIRIDQVLVCPDCEGVPTFRSGCGCCGSAFVEQEVLLHHFACAHVGPESDFRERGQLCCPKCRTQDLIAGADFEQIAGVNRCGDCDAVLSETKMIGHCLSCDLRFDAADAKLKTLYAYEVGHKAASPLVTAPNFQQSRSGQHEMSPLDS